MNAESENFEALRKLIALKRYEQPPPGYFNQLPGRILARLQDVEAEPSLWDKFVSSFVLRPAFAYGLGLVFCSVFATGVSYSMRVQPALAASQPRPAEAWEIATSSQQSPIALHVPGFDEFSGTNTTGGEPQSSLFESFGPKVMPVSYTIGN